MIPYWLILYASVEFLNTTTYYHQLKAKQLNLFFTIIIALITFNRTRHFVIPSTIEWTVNTVEHLLFCSVAIIHFTIYYYLCFPQKIKSIQLAYAAALLFNLVGFMNEYYQNFMENRPVFELRWGSWIDISINVIGSVIYLIVRITKPNSFFTISPPNRSDKF